MGGMRISGHCIVFRAHVCTVITVSLSVLFVDRSMNLSPSLLSDKLLTYPIVFERLN